MQHRREVILLLLDALQDPAIADNVVFAGGNDVLDLNGVLVAHDDERRRHLGVGSYASRRMAATTAFEVTMEDKRGTARRTTILAHKEASEAQNRS